jgi:hypothetical protein
MDSFSLRKFALPSLMLTFALASCNAGGSSVAPSQTGTAPLTPLAFSAAVAPLSAINTYPGDVNGLDDQFTPPDGNTPQGGQGNKVDKKVPCLPVMGDGYHVHVFLGIVYKGQLMALPDAIGMVNPGPESKGYTNTAQCFYEIHTHDASGIVHLEVRRTMPVSAVFFKVKHILDVWGISHDKHSFGPFKGKVRIFTGLPPALGQVTVSHYTRFTGADWTDIGLQSHEVIWVEIGKPYFNANQLPPVTFYMEF